ncbi:hypothetical protein DFJ74DRAFT_664240 [Hyaloraphidium curvatum]|nr:hypothetical protein DFJ74DRAFT_664240 [Hyaloraphidium curvatum]
MAGAAAWGPPSPASSLPTESDFGGGPLWRDQAEQLQDENARLRAELDALRAALAGKGGAAAGGTPAPVGHPGQLAGADKLAGFPVPGLPGNPFAGTLQAAQSAAGVGLPAPGPPEPPRLRIALPEGSTPLLRHIVAALVRNGNVPMGPSDIAHTIRNHIAEVGSGEDLGRLFDADPASATFGAMHSVFQRAKQLGVEPLLGRIKEGQHRGYFVAGLPDVARGTIAVFPTPEGDIELPDARPDTPSPPTPPAAAEPDPLAPLLSARELTFCLQNRITPSTFVSASVTLEDECKRRGGLREKEAAALAGAAAWEPGQWTAFWNFLLRFSYVWMRRSKRRGRRAQEESSDDEGGLYPAVPFFRSVDEAGRATEHYGELPPRFRPVQAASTAGSESGRRAWKPPGMPARRRMGGDAPPKRVRVSADDDTLVVEMANGTMYRWVVVRAGIGARACLPLSADIATPSRFPACTATTAARPSSTTSKATSTTSASPTTGTTPVTPRPSST